MLNYAFLISFIVTSKVSADFAFRFKYCSFKCGCSIDLTEPSESHDKSQEPKGFYWRDFYGDIPEDAFPAGPSDQNPQTFIGKVFDPSHNGTFLTTIFEGLDYVYNAFNNSVTKKDRHMQIMCTRSPEKLQWKTITTENAKKFPYYIFVSAGAHLGYVGRSTTNIVRSFFVVKTSNSKIAYVGSAVNLTDPLEYATIDGTFKTSDTKMFLLYKETDEENSTTPEAPKNQPKSQPFFKHVYRFSLKAGSFIPSLYVEQHIGSCGFLCTNEGLDELKGRKGTKNSPQSISAMEYYWQSQQIFDKNYALLGGMDRGNQSLYVGQGYSTGLNWLDVGQSQGSSVAFIKPRYVLLEYNDVQILSTKHTEKFEWVNTTLETFASIDKSLLIPGGELDNGTQVFVGRIVEEKSITPASIRVYENGLYYGYSYDGNSDNVQLLMFKPDN